MADKFSCLPLFYSFGFRLRERGAAPAVPERSLSENIDEPGFHEPGVELLERSGKRGIFGDQIAVFRDGDAGGYVQEHVLPCIERREEDED